MPPSPDPPFCWLGARDHPPAIGGLFSGAVRSAFTLRGGDLAPASGAGYHVSHPPPSNPEPLSVHQRSATGPSLAGGSPGYELPSTHTSSRQFEFRTRWHEAGTHRDATWRRVGLVRDLLASVRPFGPLDEARNVQTIIDWTGTYPQEAAQFYRVADAVPLHNIPSAGLTEDQRQSIDLAALVKLSQISPGGKNRTAVLRGTPWFARVSQERGAATAPEAKREVFAHLLDDPITPGSTTDRDGFWFGVLLTFVHRGRISRLVDPSTGRVAFAWDVRPIDRPRAVEAARYLGVPWPADAATARPKNDPMLFYCPAFDKILQQTGTQVRCSWESPGTFQQRPGAPVRQREDADGMFAARLKENRTTHYENFPSVVLRAMLAGMVEAVGTVQGSQNRARSKAPNVMLQFTGEPSAVEAIRRLAGLVAPAIPLAESILQERGTPAEPRDRFVWRISGATTVDRFLAGLTTSGTSGWPLTERAGALRGAARKYDVVRGATSPVHTKSLPKAHIHTDLVLAALGGYHRGSRVGTAWAVCAVAGIESHQDLLPKAFYETGRGTERLPRVQAHHITRACNDLVRQEYIETVGAGCPAHYALTEKGQDLVTIAHNRRKRPIEILRETEDEQFKLEPGLTMFASTLAGSQGVLIRDTVRLIRTWYQGVRFLYGDDLKPSHHEHLRAEGVILGYGKPDLVFLHRDPKTGDRRLGVVEVVSAKSVKSMSNPLTTDRVDEIRKDLLNEHSLEIDYLTIFQKAPPLEARVKMKLYEKGRFWEPEFGDTPPYNALAEVPRQLPAPFPRTIEIAQLDVFDTPGYIETATRPSETDALFDPWAGQEYQINALDTGAIEADLLPPPPRPRLGR